MRVTGINRLNLMEELNSVLSQIEHLNKIEEDDFVLVAMPDKSTQSAIVDTIFIKPKSNDETVDKVYSLVFAGTKRPLPILVEGKRVVKHYSDEEALKLTKLQNKYNELTAILDEHIIYTEKGLIKLNRFKTDKADKAK